MDDREENDREDLIDTDEIKAERNCGYEIKYEGCETETKKRKRKNRNHGYYYRFLDDTRD